MYAIKMTRLRCLGMAVSCSAITYGRSADGDPDRHYRQRNYLQSEG